MEEWKNGRNVGQRSPTSLDTKKHNIVDSAVKEHLDKPEKIKD